MIIWRNSNVKHASAYLCKGRSLLKQWSCPSDLICLTNETWQSLHCIQFYLIRSSSISATISSLFYENFFNSLKASKFSFIYSSISSYSMYLHACIQVLIAWIMPECKTGLSLCLWWVLCCVPQQSGQLETHHFVPWFKI